MIEEHLHELCTAPTAPSTQAAPKTLKPARSSTTPGAARGNTSGRRPVCLVYAEECASLAEALRREHQIKHWTRVKQVPGLTDIVAVAAGDSHSLALTGAGAVWAWGANTNGQLGDGTTTAHATPAAVPGLPPIVGIAAGGSHSLAVAADGTLWAWGGNNQGQLGDGTTTQRLVPGRGARPGGRRRGGGGPVPLARAPGDGDRLGVGFQPVRPAR